MQVLYVTTSCCVGVRRQKKSSGRRYVACCVANKRNFHLYEFLFQKMYKVQPKLFQQNIERLKSRCLQKSKFVDWGEGGSLAPLRPPAFIMLLLTSKKANLGNFKFLTSIAVINLLYLESRLCHNAVICDTFF